MEGRKATNRWMQKDAHEGKLPEAARESRHEPMGEGILGTSGLVKERGRSRKVKARETQMSHVISLGSVFSEQMGPFLPQLIMYSFSNPSLFVMCSECISVTEVPERVDVL